MSKNKWYYENQRTGEITDVREAANWWVECGDCVNHIHWSECCQEWLTYMVQEP